MKQMMRKYPLIVAVIALAIGLAGINIPTNSDLGAAMVRYVLTAIMIAIMIQMGAGDSLHRVTQGAGHTLRKCIYVLSLSFLLGMISVISPLRSRPLPEGLAVHALINLVYCISVGLFEESLFRGIIFGSIVRKLGGTRKGVVSAVLLASLIFGFIHIIPYILEGSYDAAGVTQAILKILQTGVFGILMATLYLRNKNFWSIALVHALNDFFMMAGNLFRDNSDSYVASGSTGTTMIVLYSIITLLYIPPMISSVRILKKLDTPEYGIFKSVD